MSARCVALKGTPLAGSKIYIGGTASVFKDMQDGNSYDLMIAGISALILIFIIMLLITRSVVSSDDPAILAMAREHGFETIARPAELATAE